MTKHDREATNPNRLAVRRVARSTTVQMCDLLDPEDIATMGSRYWLDLLHHIRTDTLRPRLDGENLLIEIHDPAAGQSPHLVCTTKRAYTDFQKAAVDGRFDGLKPAPYGLGFGPWIWAAGVVEEAVAKALDGVA
ncbi:hypothetical protein ACIA8R_52970 [Nonomuraea sp. NPDC051191]|uniref:hypothetical protein n=1 Tax=Nonomuraea sp. NPDC051191 TaxID=3364372 RepID=UPI0037B7DF46